MLFLGVPSKHFVCLYIVLLLKCVDSILHSLDLLSYLGFKLLCVLYFLTLMTYSTIFPILKSASEKLASLSHHANMQQKQEVSNYSSKLKA